MAALLCDVFLNIVVNAAEMALTVVDMVEAGGDLACFYHVVFDGKDGEFLFSVERGKFPVDVPLAGDVDASRRFVEDKKVWMAHEGSGDEDFLMLAARKVSHSFMHVAFHTGHGKDVFHREIMKVEEVSVGFDDFLHGNGKGAVFLMILGHVPDATGLTGDGTGNGIHHAKDEL